MATAAHKIVVMRERGAEVEQRIGSRTRRWLALLLVVLHIGLALWWNTAVPLGEGPDEPGHLQYVLFLAREGRLPVQRNTPEMSDVPGEGHQPPLAYWLMVPAVGWLPPDELVLEMGSNPQFRWSGGEEPNAYFRSSREYMPYTGIALAWHLARVCSALLGGITVWLTYLIGRKFFPSVSWVALGAAGLVAFNPQFIFAHALVSNDPLLITLTSALIYVCGMGITWEAATSSWQRSSIWAVVLGGLLGLMLITKQSALAFVPLPLLGIVLSRLSLKQKLSSAVLITVVASAISSWWYLRNARLYGDALGLAAFQQTFATGDFSAASWRNWNDGLWNLLRSSWGMFGWLTIALNDGAYQSFAMVLALAVVGLVASLGFGWWHGRGAIAVLLLGAGGLAFAWTVAFAQTAGAVAWQGRFLFPAVSALALLLACGLGAVLPRRSALLMMLALLALLGVVLPSTLIKPTYAVYTLPSQPADTGNVYGRFDVGWKRGMELREVVIANEAVAGRQLDVTLTWHALEQMDRPWSTFIHLVDAQEQIIAEQNAQPLGGRFPTNSWVRGDWIRDQQTLSLSGVAPGTYQLQIGVWDEASGERLGVYDRDDQLFGDRIEIGPIVVKARQ